MRPAAISNWCRAAPLDQGVRHTGRLIRKRNGDGSPSWKGAAMAAQNRMMTLIAFLQAQNCSNLPGSWRHPATVLDFLTPEYYQRIARTLEDGKIQMAFFDDRLALPDLYTGDHAEAVAAGVRAKIGRASCRERV